MEWNFSRPDWEERLRAGKSIMPDLPLNEEEANRAVAIFDKLKLPDVAEQPTMKEAAGEWQREIARAIFGSLVGRERMVPEVFCMVPKKNSKTTGGAALTITGLLMNTRPWAELIYVGPTQEVADLAFTQSVGMIAADGYLMKRFHVAHHTKTITDLRSKSKLKIKTFDMKVMTGAKPVWILLDELHLMSSIAGAARVLGQIRGGMLPNPEAVLVMITTQSDMPPAGVFRAELQYARGVRDGRIRDGTLLPLIYEFPEAMQMDKTMPWRDPKVWPQVLPNLGRSITLPRLIKDYEKAREKGIDEERRWASQHLNIEIGLALHSERWIGADYWESAADPAMTLETIIESCEVAVMGIDGGGLEDLLGVSVIGRDRATKQWLHWGKAWAQPDVLKGRPEIAERLMDFAADGDLIICEDPTQDLREVADIAERLWKCELLPEKGGIGFDPQAVAALIDEIVGRGIPKDCLAAVAQGYRLSSAVWGMERKLKDGTFWHCGRRMMNWVVGNAKVEQAGNAVIITKQAAGKAKIDPLMACFDAVKLMERNPEARVAPKFALAFARRK